MTTRPSPVVLAAALLLLLLSTARGADAPFLSPEGRPVSLRQALGTGPTLLLLVGAWEGRTTAMLERWTEQAGSMRGRIRPLVLVMGSSRGAANATMAGLASPPRWLLDAGGWAARTLTPPTLPCLALVDADGSPLLVSTCLHEEILRRALRNPTRLVREARRRATLGVPDALPPATGPWGLP